MSEDQKNVWKEKAKGLKLDFEMKMLNMKNKEKDDQEADIDSPQKQAPNGTAPVKTDSRAAPQATLSDEAGQAAGAGANKDDGSQLSMTSVEDEKMEGNMMAVIGQNIKQTEN